MRASRHERPGRLSSLQYSRGVTNKEMYRKIQAVIPPGARTLPFIRHQSRCVWWESHKGCDCSPVFLIEVYVEIDGTMEHLQEAR